MIHVSAYRSLTSVTVEVRCNHGSSDHRSSHLIYRETIEDPGPSGYNVVEALADVACSAARAALHGDVETYDDCGW